MKNSLETKLGIFVILAVFAAWAIIETLGSADFFRHGFHVSARFDSAQDLKVGDRVKMAGVEIGRVEKIALAENKASVAMKLHGDAVVKTDSKAVIKFTGLMGQNFVAISFGSPGANKAEEGMVLETAEQADLNAIMAKLDNAAAGIQNITKVFSGDKIDNILGPLTDFFKQNSAPITATISNVKNISSQIAAGQGTIGKLITDETLYHATTSSMTNLNQILQKVNQGQGTIGKLVNDQDFYKNAKLSMQKLDKAADSLEDTGPLSVIGTMMSQFGL